ncbi:hypothetical protein RCL1_001982 [Eukaryota sp. TZLM3-RCL]
MSVDGGRSIMGSHYAPLPSVVGIPTFNSIGDVVAGSHVIFYGLFRPMIPCIGFVRIFPPCLLKIKRCDFFLLKIKRCDFFLLKIKRCDFFLFFDFIVLNAFYFIVKISWLIHCLNQWKRDVTIDGDVELNPGPNTPQNSELVDAMRSFVPDTVPQVVIDAVSSVLQIEPLCEIFDVIRLQNDSCTVRYVLNSCIVHTGEPQSGHYITFQHKEGDWIIHDDLSDTLFFDVEDCSGPLYLLLMLTQ